MKSFEEVMRLTRTVSSHTALSDDEALELFYLCAMDVPRGGLVVEVGCQLGRSSSLLAQVAIDWGFRTIHVDPFTDQPDFLAQWHAMMWQIGGRDHAYTHLCMRTEQAKPLLESIGGDGIDLVYIDGDHEYPGVMMDLDTLCPMINLHGYLAMHDYGSESLPGVWKAASEYLDYRWKPMGTHGTLGVWRRQ